MRKGKKKVSALIQKELAALIAADLRRGGAANLLNFRNEG